MFRRGGHFWARPVLPAWAWGAIALAVLVLLVIAVILIVRHRRAKQAQLEELNETQRRTLEEFETQVLALLSQHGGQLGQVRIAAALGLPSELVADRLLEMEAQGLIERDWTVEEYTYSVRQKGN